MRGQGTCLEPSRISHVAPSVGRGIAVQQFTIVAFARRADSIVVAGNGGEVTQAQYLIILVLGFPEEGDRAAPAPGGRAG
jgi:hypothetical protein